MMTTTQAAPGPYEDYRIRLRRMIDKAVMAATKKVKAAANAGIMLKLALYYKPSTAHADGELMLLDLGDAIPEGFVAASSDGTDTLNCDVPYAHYYAWVQQRSYYLALPLLAHCAYNGV